MGRIPTSSMIAELKSKLAMIAQMTPNSDLCIILQKMLDRGQLSYEIRSESGRERIQYYFSDGECPLVEEIEDVPNDVVRAFLDLFVLGKLKFAIDDVRGLNVYWFPRLDGRSVHSQLPAV